MEEIPEFEKYSYAQLAEVSNNIDAEKYPERKEKVLMLLNERASTEEGLLYREQNNPKYKTFLRRFLASIIDGLIISVFIWSLSVIITHTPDNLIIFNIAYFLISFGSLIYSVYYHSITGQTLGKLVCGVKVVEFATESEIKFKHAFMRDSVPIIFIALFYMFGFIETNETLVIFVSVLYSLWGLLEIITMLLNKKRRALHDFIGKTVVVRINGI